MVLYKKALLSAVTEDEKELATAFFSGGGPLRSLPDEDCYQSIIKLLGSWTIAVAPAMVPSEDEYKLICNFIIKNYGYLTIRELSLCIELSLRGQLDEPARIYNGSFSVEYCSRILNSYRVYRNEKLKTIDENSQRLILSALPPPAPDPKEQAEQMKQIIRNEYQYYQKTGLIIDFSDIIYTHLKANHLLGVVTQQTKDEALKYAADKAREIFKQAKGIQSIGSTLNRFQFRGEAEARNKFARGYILKKLFDTLDVEKIIKGITPKQFVTKK